MHGFRFCVLTVPVVLLLLVACGKRGNWPEGGEAIHWDRDTCARCSMAISDPRFAVELVRSNPKRSVLKFDDFGCLVAWAKELNKKTGEPPWWEDPQSRVWVADFNSLADDRDAVRWLDARMARYIGRSSPMGYNHAAVESADEQAVGFDEVLQRIQAHGHEHGGGFR
jgi:nitrous oxide reductase accessory protein NosL